jgi:hypothetical protein
MANRRVLPKFANEAEEAKWWFEHSDELDEHFLAAAADGTLRRGTIARRFGLSSHIIHIAPKDAELAKAQADKRGPEYEKYVQSLLHQALEQQEKVQEVFPAEPAA